jgi:hypothetical protein
MIDPNDTSPDGLAAVQKAISDYAVTGTTLGALITNLAAERDRQYDENVSMIARYAALEAERDKSVALRCQLAATVLAYLDREPPGPMQPVIDVARAAVGPGL